MSFRNRSQSIRKAAQRLARLHRKADPAMLGIYFFPSEAEIRLVEVSRDALPTWQVFPISFDPDRVLGILYPSTIIVLSPEEWAGIGRGTLSLPESWDLKQSEILLDAAA